MVIIKELEYLAHYYNSADYSVTEQKKDIEWIGSTTVSKDDTTIGQSIYGVSKSAPESVFITNLTIDPAHRRKGYGTKLMLNTLKDIESKLGRPIKTGELIIQTTTEGSTLLNTMSNKFEKLTDVAPLIIYRHKYFKNLSIL